MKQINRLVEEKGRMMYRKKYWKGLCFLKQCWKILESISLEIFSTLLLSSSVILILGGDYNIQMVQN